MAKETEKTIKIGELIAREIAEAGNKSEDATAALRKIDVGGHNAVFLRGLDLLDKNPHFRNLLRSKTGQEWLTSKKFRVEMAKAATTTLSDKKTETDGEKRERKIASSSRNPIAELLGSMVRVPRDGGSLTFKMGSEEYDSEKPVHTVTFKEAFEIGAMQVTQAQYEAVMGENPSHFKGPDRLNNPVERVSWNDAMEFCEKLSAKTGQKFTLPTEAQWEYACRAGSETKYCFGDDEKDLGDYAWYGANSEGTTHPVGRKKPNAWGLYDVHGNVWEWCLDHWHGNYENAPKDGSARLTDEADATRVLRGGSWFFGPMNCRSAIRPGPDPSSTWYGSGFRVVCVSRTQK